MTDITIPSPEQSIDIPDTGAKPKTSIVDIDALIAGQIKDAVDELEVAAHIVLFGAEWRLVEPTNAFVTIRMADLESDPAALAKHLIAMVHPDERGAFMQAFSSAPHLPVEAVLTIMKAMSEAVAQRPTKPSPGSGRTSGKRTSGRS